MQQFRVADIRWRAVAIGWVVAVVAGLVIGLILRGLFGLDTGPATGTGGVTVGGGIIALITGFLAYVAGGYVAGRQAQVAGPLNGAMTAVFGIVVGIVLAVILAILGLLVMLISGGGDAQFPSAAAVFDFAGGGILFGLILLVVNIAGGYLGGRLGEPSGTQSQQTSSRVR